MAGTRKARVPMAEQIRLINECRQRGMADADWCRENDTAVSTFYNWVSRCRKAVSDQILVANYGHLVRGKVILQPHGKEFFTWYSKHLFTLHGKHFFT